VTESTAALAAQAAHATDGISRHHFLLRRLHSLTGIVPIGVFLIVHLITNSSVLWGGFALHGDAGLGADASILTRGIAYFQKEVSWINEQVPHLLLIEISLWLAIGFHSILGLIYIRSGKSNLKHYAFQDNWRYSLQRWSGYIGILFIFYHIATLRWGWTFLVPEGVDWGHSAASSTLVLALRGSAEGWSPLGVVVSLGYFLGITLLVFHFANGLWTAAITWGLTISAKAQKRWGVVCALLGVGLMGMAWSTLIAFMFLVDVQEAERVEAVLGHNGHAGQVESAHTDPEIHLPSGDTLQVTPQESH